MPFLVLDKEGAVVAVAGANHIAPPAQGSVREVSKEQADAARDALSWQPKAAAPVKDLKQLRRDKMWAISDSSVESRGRVFKEFPHVHLMDQHRHIDVMVMYMRGHLKDNDTIVTRNLKSGEYDSVTVGSLLNEIEETFHLRQMMRQHDQVYRNIINTIYKDPKKTDEQKYAEIEAVEVPPRLGVSTNSAHDALIIEKK